MFKRLVLAVALGFGAATVALADDAPKSADECLKMSFDLAKSAEGKKLGDDKLAKLEELLQKMEGHCDAKQFAEAATVSKDVKATIDGK